MTPKEKAAELVDKFHIDLAPFADVGTFNKDIAKQCALIAVDNEYKALREQLFNLRACYVIENPLVYTSRLDHLNTEEQQVEAEIEKL